MALVTRAGLSRLFALRVAPIVATALLCACSANVEGGGGTGGAMTERVSATFAKIKARVGGALGLTTRPTKTTPARFVRFEVLSEVNGGPWASVAEFSLLDAAGNVISRDGWTVKADSAATSDPASNAVDGDVHSMWQSKWEGTATQPPHWLEIDLQHAVEIGGFRYLPRQDKSRNGTVARYKLYVSNDGVDWGAAVDEGNLGKAKEQVERLVLLGRQPENRPPGLRPMQPRETAENESVSFAAFGEDPDGDTLTFGADGLPAGVSIDRATGVLSGQTGGAGRYKPTVTVTDENGLTASASFDWVVVSTPPGAVRYVRLEAMTEIRGGPWASMAEFQVIGPSGSPLPRTNWKVSADSFEKTDPPSNAIDGDVASIWHTQWTGVAASQPPHAFTVDLGAQYMVTGFQYLPRQDETRNGTIGQYKFYVSRDGKDWGSPVAQGDFSALGESNVEKTVYLK